MKSILPLLLAIIQLLSASVNAKEPPDRFWNRGRGYSPFTHATENGIEINNRSSATITDSCTLHSPMTGFSLTFRATNINSRPGHRYKYTDADGMGKSVTDPAWGFFISSPTGQKTWVTVSPEEKQGPISSSAALRIIISSDGGKKTLYSGIADSGLNPFDGANIWRLTTCGNELILSAGNRSMSEIAKVQGNGECHAFGFAASPGAAILITDISIIQDSPLSGMKAGEWQDPGRLDRHFADSDDPLEGYWTLFDRTLDESLLRMGGDYRLAIVKDGGRYEIIYIDGAKTNSGKWERGMAKGILYPEPFPGIFNVEWIDAEGKHLGNGIKAQTGEGDTLLIQFPYQSSTVRLRRLPATAGSAASG